MKRIPATILLFATLGVLVTYGVGVAYSFDGADRILSHRAWRKHCWDFNEAWGTSFAGALDFRWYCELRVEPAESVHQEVERLRACPRSQMNRDGYPWVKRIRFVKYRYDYRFVEAGWPWRSMHGWVVEIEHCGEGPWEIPEQSISGGNLVLDTGDIPLWPLWPGLFANAGIYGTILWAMWFVPGAIRRVRRRRRGACVRCGYDLQGVTGICPECGSPAPSAGTM